MSNKLDQMNERLTILRQQLEQIAEVSKKVSAWSDGPNKDKALDAIFANQETLIQHCTTLVDEMWRIANGG